MSDKVKQDIISCLQQDKSKFGISVEDIASNIDCNDLKLVKDLITELMREEERFSEKSYKTDNLVLYKLDINPLKQSYIDLQSLRYSEENIAELFSIANKVIRFLESQDPNEKTNTALHFVMLTWDKEFKYFKDKKRDYLENNFNEARSNLMSDLALHCRKYWEPDNDPPN